jgi:NDP-sugar pyrophosphorylase family protein
MSCSSGIYVFQREITEYLPKVGDIEKTTLPILTRKKALKVFIHNGKFLTVNTVKELEQAELELSA